MTTSPFCEDPGDDMPRPLYEYCQRFERRDASLSICNLHYVPLGSRGAAKLAKALDRDKDHLLVLFCDNCQIGDAGMEVLAESLSRQRALSHVYLSYNAFGNRGAKAISNLIQQCPTISVIKMIYNNIGDSGAEEISQALEQNQSLTTLDLEGNNIQTPGQVALATSLQTNASLTTLNLQRNLQRHSKSHACERRTVQDAFLKTLHHCNKVLRNLILDTPDCASPTFQPIADRVHAVIHSNGTPDEFALCEQIDHFLALNRLGRRFFGNPDIRGTVWTRVLSKAASLPSARKSKKSRLSEMVKTCNESCLRYNQKDVLFAVLKSRPDLLCDHYTYSDRNSSATA